MGGRCHAVGKMCSLIHKSCPIFLRIFLDRFLENLYQSKDDIPCIRATFYAGNRVNISVECFVYQLAWSHVASPAQPQLQASTVFEFCILCVHLILKSPSVCHSVILSLPSSAQVNRIPTQLVGLR